MNASFDSLVSVLTAIVLEMSHAVVRVEPTAAQLYLDRVLDEILSAKGIQPDAEKRDKVTFAEIIFHSLKKHLGDLNMKYETTVNLFSKRSSEEIWDKLILKTNLEDYKRLRGGIVIVKSLPHTHTGKLKRRECKLLIERLIKEEQDS